MFEKQNKIILVDNIQSELDTLAKSFLDNGLGCRTFLYDTTYSEPLTNVRIAFFDINLTEKTVDTTLDSDEDILKHNSAVFNDLADALNLYISKKNGPYVLIFWTKNQKVIKAFKSFMQDPNRGFGETAQPILIGCIDKADYSTKEMAHNLADKILDLLNSDNRIKFLFDIENNAKLAGENTLNRLYEILPKEDKWGESNNLFMNLDKVLSKIAASTLGFEHARNNPGKAIYEGILPIINYELLNSTTNVDWNKIVTNLTGADKPGNIISPDIVIQHKINSLYHIEDYNKNHQKDIRGCLLEIDKSSKEIMQSLEINDADTWISKLLAIKDGNETQAIRKAEILKESKIIAVEFSAACDYSNKKQRINKYILGVLTTNLNPDLKNDLHLNSRPDACYHLGGCCFHHNGLNCHIWLNLNYVFGANPNDPRLGQPIFILKKEIMDMLGNKYASHISRIGITSL